MNTNDIRHDLKAYLDGELSAERANEVRTAIETDSELEKEMEFMKKLSSSLKSFKVGPEVSSSQISNAVAATRKRRPWFALPRFGRLAWSGTVAAAAVLICAAIIVPVFQSAKEKAFSPSAEMDAVTVPGEAKAPNESSTYGLGGGETAMREREDPSLAGRSSEDKPKIASGSDVDVTADVEARSVIRTGALKVRVDNIEKAEKETIKLVKAWGGYIETTESTSLDSQRPELNLTMRVPVKKFDDALLKLETLGVRIDKSIDGRDVTNEIIDIEARLKNLRAKEESYRRILGHARKVGEVLEVQQYLSDVRGEIESADAQLKSLKKFAAMSVITLILEQKLNAEIPSDTSAGWADEAWGASIRALGSVARFFGVCAIYLFTLAPVWLPIMFVGWIMLRKTAVSKQQ